MSDREIEVDLWSTDMHKVEIGIKKQEEYRAKSRHFTKDTDIIGKVSGAMEGYITIRIDPWDQEPTSQRLIMRLFTESMNWKASLEELVAQAMARTLATGHGVPTFTIILNNKDYLVPLERAFSPSLLNKEIYSFMIMDDGEFKAYHIIADRFSLGGNFTVKDHYGEKIASIDGSIMDFGGKWKIKPFEDKPIPLTFEQVLVLFCASIKHLNKIKKRLESNAKRLSKNDAEMDINRQEIRLYGNPRRLEY
ncbi:MAG: hypothetical protein ACOC38_08185 [Promethearchaeia archaeon]